jgi:hypothetical protein
MFSTPKSVLKKTLKIVSHARKQTLACLKYIEASMTIAMGAVDIDVRLLENLRKFIEEDCMRV